MKFEVKDHILVPKHEKLNEEDSKKILERYNISKLQLPKISKKDSAIKELEINPGNIIKITRNSATAGKSVFYRLVIDE